MTVYLKDFYYNMLNYYSVKELPNEAIDALFSTIAARGLTAFTMEEQAAFAQRRGLQTLAVKAASTGVSTLSSSESEVYFKFYAHYKKYIKLQILAKISPRTPDELVDQIFERAVGRFVKSILDTQYLGGNPRPYFERKCWNVTRALLDCEARIAETNSIPDDADNDDADNDDAHFFSLEMLLQLIKLSKENRQLLHLVIYYQENKDTEADLRQYNGREDYYLADMFGKTPDTIRTQKQRIIKNIKKQVQNIIQLIGLLLAIMTSIYLLLLS